MQTQIDIATLKKENERMKEQLEKLQIENEVLKDQLNIDDIGLDIDKLSRVIKMSQEEYTHKIEAQAKTFELGKLTKSVKSNVAMFETKLARVEREKAMQKVAIDLKYLDKGKSMIELIYHQRAHSAAQFDNVQYNIPEIMEFVSVR